MNNTCIILLIFVALVSCALSSYLEIPPPPQRPARFKTKEQIETYLKAVKDYYDAFKIKLVRRENSLEDFYAYLDKPSNDQEIEEDETLDSLNQSPRNPYSHRRSRIKQIHESYLNTNLCLSIA